jgi:hypothetical protein
LSSYATACVQNGDYKAAIAAERAMLQDLEIVGRLVGTLINRSEVTHKHLTTHPQYLRIRAILIEELRSHPEVAARIAARLAQVEQNEADEIMERAKVVNASFATPTNKSGVTQWLSGPRHQIWTR